MKFKFLLVTGFSILTLLAFGQRPTMELTFTADNNGIYVQLDSIKVMNRTQGGDTVLYWPDTVLSIYYVGITEISENGSGFQVFQNYPNPVADQTTISLYVPEKDKVSIIVTDILGRVILKSERVLDQGTHSFRFTPGGGNLYFFTALWRGNSSSIKILQAASHAYGSGSLEYTGSEILTPQLKVTKDMQDFVYNPGDELLYIGYANVLQSGMLDAPEESTTYTFEFATNIPCPGTPTVEYEGQVYNTIQIFSQCWLKENLNVGTMILGSVEMADNDTIEKYCYNNKPDSCDKYGGLYQWQEMMQYVTTEGVQGICPPSWHIPTDEEWKVLEGAVDSQYGIGNSVWDNNGPNRGYDAGSNLKRDTGWYVNNGTDLFGFSALPGGFRRNYDSVFLLAAYRGDWWTYTRQNIYSSRTRYMQDDNQQVGRFWGDEEFGYSVRCVRDEVSMTPIELTFTAVNNTAYVQLDSIKVMNKTQGGENVIYWPDTTLLLPVELPFEAGDDLLYIGFADTFESGILNSPEESTLLTFQFATNIPCPGTPTVEYEGQVYNTIQVFSQCWLNENLNVGTMIQGSENMANNDTIEKYCYNNEPDSCTKYGGLYQWDEMMQYMTQQSAQGICPQGWHLPSDEEWKILEGTVDSQYGIGDPVWDLDELRGFDAGANLKSTSLWISGGNGTDMYGFTGLPHGRRVATGVFSGINSMSPWWTSTGLESLAVHHLLSWMSDQSRRLTTSFSGGHAVRCLRDN